MFLNSYPLLSWWWSWSSPHRQTKPSYNLFSNHIHSSSWQSGITFRYLRHVGLLWQLVSFWIWLRFLYWYLQSRISLVCVAWLFREIMWWFVIPSVQLMNGFITGGRSSLWSCVVWFGRGRKIRIDKNIFGYCFDEKVLTWWRFLVKN